MSNKDSDYDPLNYKGRIPQFDSNPSTGQHTPNTSHTNLLPIQNNGQNTHLLTQNVNFKVNGGSENGLSRLQSANDVAMEGLFQVPTYSLNNNGSLVSDNLKNNKDQSLGNKQESSSNYDKDDPNRVEEGAMDMFRYEPQSMMETKKESLTDSKLMHPHRIVPMFPFASSFSEEGAGKDFSKGKESSRDFGKKDAKIRQTFSRKPQEVSEPFKGITASVEVREMCQVEAWKKLLQENKNMFKPGEMTSGESIESVEEVAETKIEEPQKAEDEDMDSERKTEFDKKIVTRDLEMSWALNRFSYMEESDNLIMDLRLFTEEDIQDKELNDLKMSLEQLAKHDIKIYPYHLFSFPSRISKQTVNDDYLWLSDTSEESTKEQEVNGKIGDNQEADKSGKSVSKLENGISNDEVNEVKVEDDEKTKEDGNAQDKVENKEEAYENELEMDLERELDLDDESEELNALETELENDLMNTEAQMALESVLEASKKKEEDKYKMFGELDEIKPNFNLYDYRYDWYKYRKQLGENLTLSHFVEFEQGLKNKYNLQGKGGKNEKNEDAENEGQVLRLYSVADTNLRLLKYYNHPEVTSMVNSQICDLNSSKVLYSYTHEEEERTPKDDAAVGPEDSNAANTSSSGQAIGKKGAGPTPRDGVGGPKDAKDVKDAKEVAKELERELEREVAKDDDTLLAGKESDVRRQWRKRLQGIDKQKRLRLVNQGVSLSCLDNETAIESSRHYDFVVEFEEVASQLKAADYIGILNHSFDAHYASANPHDVEQDDEVLNKRDLIHTRIAKNLVGIMPLVGRNAKIQLARFHRVDFRTGLFKRSVSYYTNAIANEKKRRKLLNKEDLKQEYDSTTASAQLLNQMASSGSSQAADTAVTESTKVEESVLAHPALEENARAGPQVTDGEVGDASMQKNEAEDEEERERLGSLHRVVVTRTGTLDKNHLKLDNLDEATSYTVEGDVTYAEGLDNYKGEHQHPEVQEQHEQQEDEGVGIEWEVHPVVKSIINLNFKDDDLVEGVQNHCSNYFVNSSDLSLVDDTKLVLLEYVEKNPLLLNNLGMASRVDTYINSTSGESIFTQEGQDKGEEVLGNVTYSQEYELFGVNHRLKTNDMQSILENTLFKAPIFYRSSNRIHYKSSTTKLSGTPSTNAKEVNNDNNNTNTQDGKDDNTAVDTANSSTNNSHGGSVGNTNNIANNNIISTNEVDNSNSTKGEENINHSNAGTDDTETDGTFIMNNMSKDEMNEEDNADTNGLRTSNTLRDNCRNKDKIEDMDEIDRTSSNRRRYAQNGKEVNDKRTRDGFDDGKANNKRKKEAVNINKVTADEGDEVTQINGNVGAEKVDKNVKMYDFLLVRTVQPNETQSKNQSASTTVNADPNSGVLSKEAEEIMRIRSLDDNVVLGIVGQCEPKVLIHNPKSKSYVDDTKSLLKAWIIKMAMINPGTDTKILKKLARKKFYPLLPDKEITSVFKQIEATPVFSTRPQALEHTVQATIKPEVVCSLESTRAQRFRLKSRGIMHLKSHDGMASVSSILSQQEEHFASSISQARQKLSELRKTYYTRMVTLNVDQKIIKDKIRYFNLPISEYTLYGHVPLTSTDMDENGDIIEVSGGSGDGKPSNNVGRIEDAKDGRDSGYYSSEDNETRYFFENRSSGYRSSGDGSVNINSSNGEYLNGSGVNKSSSAALGDSENLMLHERDKAHLDSKDKLPPSVKKEKELERESKKRRMELEKRLSRNRGDISRRVEYIERELKLANWNITHDVKIVLKGNGQFSLHGVGDPSNSGLALSLIKRQVNTGASANTTGNIYNISVVGQSNEDLRKLSMDELSKRLQLYGVSESIIKTLPRWDQVALVRQYRDGYGAAKNFDDPLNKFRIPPHEYKNQLTKIIQNQREALAQPQSRSPLSLNKYNSMSALMRKEVEEKQPLRAEQDLVNQKHEYGNEEAFDDVDKELEELKLLKESLNLKRNLDTVIEDDKLIPVPGLMWLRQSRKTPSEPFGNERAVFIYGEKNIAKVLEWRRKCAEKKKAFMPSEVVYGVNIGKRVCRNCGQPGHIASNPKCPLYAGDKLKHDPSYLKHQHPKKPEPEQESSEEELVTKRLAMMRDTKEYIRSNFSSFKQVESDTELSDLVMYSGESSSQLGHEAKHKVALPQTAPVGSKRRRAASETKDSSPKGIGGTDLKTISKILASIEKETRYRPFMSKIPESIAPNYYKIIKQPMWLSLLKLRVRSKHYANVADLVKDIFLLEINCKMYNSEHSQNAWLRKMSQVLVDDLINRIHHHMQNKEQAHKVKELHMNHINNYRGGMPQAQAGQREQTQQAELGAHEEMSTQQTQMSQLSQEDTSARMTQMTDNLNSQFSMDSQVTSNSQYSSVVLPSVATMSNMAGKSGMASVSGLSSMNDPSGSMTQFSADMSSYNSGMGMYSGHVNPFDGSMTGFDSNMGQYSTGLGQYEGSYGQFGTEMSQFDNSMGPQYVLKDNGEMVKIEMPDYSSMGVDTDVDYGLTENMTSVVPENTEDSMLGADNSVKNSTYNSGSNRGVNIMVNDQDDSSSAEANTDNNSSIVDGSAVNTDNNSVATSADDNV